MKTSARLLLASTVLLVALPAAADKAYVDYDRSFDFKSVETFTYMAQLPGMLPQDDLMDKHIVGSLVEHLTSAGLKQVESGGDIVVTYQVTTQTTPRMNSTTAVPAGGMWNSGWAYGPGWGPGWGYAGGGWVTTSTTVSHYKTGSLVVEAYDPATKQAVWRGSAQGAVPSKPKKAKKKVDNYLDKMSKKWRDMHRGE